MVIIIACSGIGLLSDTLEVMSISFAKDDIARQFGVIYIVLKSYSIMNLKIITFY